MKKIKYRIIESTQTHKERSWGDCQENNNDPSAYYDVTEPVAKLMVGDVEIAHDRPTCGSMSYMGSSKKRLKSLAEDLLKESSVKAYTKEVKRDISELRSSVEKILKAHEEEAEKREKFALRRIEDLRKGKLKEWPRFDWKTSDTIQKLENALEEK